TEAVVVSAFGYSHRYNGVKSIYADGGTGNDVILVALGVTSPAELRGGDGNDQLSYQGSGDCVIYGDDPMNAALTGNDTLVGGDGDDTLHAEVGPASAFGDKGFDKLFGGTQLNKLDGGDNDDTLQSGPGTYAMLGGQGNDQIIWGNGSPSGTIDGGAGNDALT